MVKFRALDRASGETHADMFDEFYYSFRRDSQTAHTGNGGHAGIVPTAYKSAVNQLYKFAFAHDSIGHVKTGKLNLLGMENVQLIQEPVIQRPVVFKLNRAQGMGDALQGIGLPVRPVIHGINAPAITCAVMALMQDAVHDRIPHIHIGMGHVNLCPQHFGAVFEFSRLHPLEQV